VRRFLGRLLVRVAPPAAGVLVALALGALLLLVTGKSPPGVVREFVSNFGAYELGGTIYWASVYTFSGLAVAYAFQAGLFNIGGEGQLLFGGFVLSFVGSRLAQGTPSIVAIPVCLAACFLGGAAWAAVPAILRARRGVHEVISTILMNLIAAPATVFLLDRYKRSHPELAESVHLSPIVPGAWLSRITALGDTLAESQASTSIVFALATAAAVWWLVRRTRPGFELRAIGLNADAARASGIPVASVQLRALLFSGGLAAWAAVPEIMGGEHHYWEQGMLGGAGFTGIAVAVLAGSDPLTVVLSAAVMGFLTEAGEVVGGTGPDHVRREIVLVLQAIVIVAVLVAQGIARNLIAAAEARRARRVD
jgi:simple sugar transport system permease protein